MFLFTDLSFPISDPSIPLWVHHSVHKCCPVDCVTYRGLGWEVKGQNQAIHALCHHLPTSSLATRPQASGEAADFRCIGCKAECLALSSGSGLSTGWPRKSTKPV
jgi:hypothetical protein